MANENEIWKPLVGYETEYLISSYGRLKSIKHGKSIILKPHINTRNGYVYYLVSKNGKSKNSRAHRLVALTFIPTSNTKLQVNHKDGNKTNNRADNLEWCTQSENMIHAYKMGLEKPRGLKVIRLDDGKIFETATEAVLAVGGRLSNLVLRVCRGERSHYREQHFAFYDDYINGTIPEYKGKYKRKGSKTLWR
nr:MAG TPA: homing endonuclease [Caudoviricetes sp.]